MRNSMGKPTGTPPTSAGAAAAPPAPTVPLVSICLPTYNGEKSLRNAVASVLAQTWTDFELIAVDDHSTDRTPDVLSAFRDPRLTVVRNPANLGPEGNWNRALSLARGKYVKLFHQDDLLAPDCLARQVAVLERHDTAVLALSSRTILSAAGAPITVRGAPWKEGLVTAQAAVTACVRAGTNVLGEPSAGLFRRETALKAGAFDGSIPYLIDLDYWMRLLRFGPAYYLPAPLASFRISAGSCSVAMRRRQAGEFIAFVDKLAASGAYRISAIDRWRGRRMAVLNAFLRGLAYRIWASR